ncbi:hypothetical protein F5144DRAFT_496076 [Chaetomium tenue]|uniref:Uncharacterized protein n=1 Tax=Chaetomium tenue TaxID=1854479 RepID=A0ACB7NX96_9PEZI|nr:hypothetical protein F5144DRAFT_496076 [Chaetomium globosum]
MAGNKTGFPLLAQRISVSPDYESFIFRKFDRLSARNLLHLESRLAYLEHKLDQVDAKAALLSADNETRRSIRAWEAFEENAADPARPEHMHMKLAAQVQETLKEYQEALLRQNQIAALEAPKNRAFNVAYDQFHDDINDECGHTKRRRPLLAGLSESRLSESKRHDLVAVRRPADKDLLSRFLQDHWVFKEHSKTTRVTNETEHIKESHVAWVAAVISTVLAAILLLGAIVTLRLVKEENTQLGLIATFTVLFAVSVGIFTNARRAEIFAATAAYAAVLVVFVSSSPGNCTCTLGG